MPHMTRAIVSPLEVVRRLIGADGVVAGIVSRDRSAVVKWRRRGFVPSECQRDLLTFAGLNGIPLKAEHLIVGATEAEIDALLASEPMVKQLTGVAAE